MVSPEATTPPARRGPTGKPDLPTGKYFRPSRWYFAPAFVRLVPVILRTHGAASIFMGRTPHEVRDELCRAHLR